MAIDVKQYVKITENLKIHKEDNSKFLFDLRYEGKRYRKVLKLRAKGWSKKEYVGEAKMQLSKYITELQQGKNPNEDVNLDKLKALYFETLKDTDWTDKLDSFYATYICKVNGLGKKKIKLIREMHINAAISYQKKEGLAPRTQKQTLDLLRPMFDYAIRNQMLDKNPTQFIKIKIPTQKKPVTHASAMLKTIYNGICTLYEKEPFYKAMFLFALVGRRKSEILTLKWHNVDLDNNIYWIEDTKTDENQKFSLPQNIKNELLLLHTKKSPLVFASPVTGRKMENIDRQVAKLREHVGIPQLALHYMRNIVVSALSEQGVDSIYLSGILGHRDSTTINKYLSQNYHNASEVGNRVIDEILELK